MFHTFTKIFICPVTLTPVLRQVSMEESVGTRFFYLGVSEEIVLNAIQESGLFWSKAVELQQVRLITFVLH